MRLKKYLAIQYRDKYFQLGKIEWHEDGSIYLFLPSDRQIGAFNKISIHTSGRINYGIEMESHFIDPLTNIQEPTIICSFYIPSLSKLKELDHINRINTGLIPLHSNSYFCISIVLSNNLEIYKQNPNHVLALDFGGYVVLNFIIANLKIDAQNQNYIMLYTPHTRKYTSQVIDRYEAELAYNKQLYQAEGFTILGPDENGELLVLFEVVMRRTPFFKIEFKNPDLWVDRLRGNKYKLKFIVKSKKYGNKIVKDAKRIIITDAALDARRYGDDEAFIPEVFLKPQSSGSE